MAGNVVYLFVTVDAGVATHGGKSGFVKMSDILDKGGKANVDLPLVDVKLTVRDAPLYKDSGKAQEIKKLVKDTRLRVLSTSADMIQIEVVDGPDTTKTGWMEKNEIKDET